MLDQSSPASQQLPADQAVSIDGLSHSFGAHQILRDVSLTVNCGEVVALIGASGSGKTTLLRCINSLEVPQRGKIFVNGEAMGIHGSDGTFAKLPDRLLNEPLTLPSGRVAALTPDRLRAMIDAYYDERGLDREGRPDPGLLGGLALA